MVRHIVEIYGNGLLFHELYAFYADLREFSRLLEFVLSIDTYLINAALLRWLIDLRRYYIIEADGLTLLSIY